MFPLDSVESVTSHILRVLQIHSGAGGCAQVISTAVLIEAADKYRISTVWYLLRRALGGTSHTLSIHSGAGGVGGGSPPETVMNIHDVL